MYKLRSLSVSLHYLYLDYCNFYTYNLTLYTQEITVFGQMLSDWYLLISLNLVEFAADRYNIFWDSFFLILHFWKCNLKITRFEKEKKIWFFSLIAPLPLNSLLTHLILFHFKWNNFPPTSGFVPTPSRIPD